MNYECALRNSLSKESMKDKEKGKKGLYFIGGAFSQFSHGQFPIFTEFVRLYS